MRKLGGSIPHTSALERSVMSGYTKTKSGLVIPKTKREDYPHFKTRIFYCYYQADVDKFKELVESTDGYWCGAMEIPFLNNWNGKVGTQFCCIYQWHEELSMAVMC